MITMILGVDVTHPAINESTHQQVKSLSERWSKVWNWSEQRKAQLLKVFYYYELTWMSKRPKTFRKYISYFHIKSQGGPRLNSGINFVATFQNFVDFTFINTQMVPFSHTSLQCWLSFNCCKCTVFKIWLRLRLKCESRFWRTDDVIIASLFLLCLFNFCCLFS